MPETSNSYSYKELLNETQYLKNLIAGIISRFGDSIDSIAFTWMVFALTGSASLTAVTFGVNILVSVLLQPFTAALITNWNKKAIILVTDFGRGTLVVITAVLYVTSLIQPWMLVVFTGCMSLFEAFRNPAGTSVFPHIISKEKYTVAMSLSGTLQKMAEIIGMAAAGAVIYFLGVQGALLIDAVTFFASAAILATLKLPKHEKKLVPNAASEFVKNTKEGFVYVKNHRLIRMVCVMACVINCLFVPLNALQAAFAQDGLKLGVEALSVIGVSFSSGMVIGSFVFPSFAKRLKRYTLFMGSLFCFSTLFIFLVGVACIPVIAVKWVALVIVLSVNGIFVAFANTIVQVAFMEKVEEVYLARVSGIMGSLCLGAMPVVSFLLAGFAKFVPVLWLLFGFGILSVIVMCFFKFVNVLKEI